MTATRPPLLDDIEDANTEDLISDLAQLIKHASRMSQYDINNLTDLKAGQIGPKLGFAAIAILLMNELRKRGVLPEKDRMKIAQTKLYPPSTVLNGKTLEHDDIDKNVAFYLKFIEQQQQNIILEKIKNQTLHINAIYVYWLLDQLNQNGYELCLMSQDVKPEINKLYLGKSDNSRITYTVITPDGKSVKNIQTDISAPEPFSLEELNKLKSQILDATTEARHTVAEKQEGLDKPNQKNILNIPVIFKVINPQNLPTPPIVKRSINTPKSTSEEAQKSTLNKPNTADMSFDLLFGIEPDAEPLAIHPKKQKSNENDQAKKESESSKAIKRGDDFKHQEKTKKEINELVRKIQDDTKHQEKTKNEISDLVKNLQNDIDAYCKAGRKNPLGKFFSLDAKHKAYAEDLMIRIYNIIIENNKNDKKLKPSEILETIKTELKATIRYLESKDSIRLLKTINQYVNKSNTKKTINKVK